MKKKKNIPFMILYNLAFIIIITFSIAYIVLAIRTTSISDDYDYLKEDSNYSEVVRVDNISVVKQELSSGYAIIEMIGTWQNKNITEDKLIEEYHKDKASKLNGLKSELNKQFPNLDIKAYKYLKNTDLIIKSYESLKRGNPVILKWTSRLDDSWAMNYSLITGMDIPGNTITILNTYGYSESITINDLIKRTSFNAYKDMPFYINLGFAFGFYEKNAIITLG